MKFAWDWKDLAEYSLLKIGDDRSYSSFRKFEENEF